MSCVSNEQAMAVDLQDSIEVAINEQAAKTKADAIPPDQASPLNDFYDAFKRAIDIVGATIGLILFAPLMGIIAVLIRFTSPGPVLFKQKRPGLGGVLFVCYKFRTMVRNAEAMLVSDATLRSQFEVNFKLKNDMRVTTVGKWLRKLSLDELPQLFNILNGTMSIIGPRPILMSQAASYGPHLPKLLSVKPGLGGYWQAYGRSDTSHDARIQYDMHYVNNRCTLLDLKLILMTIVVVIKRDGAY